MIWCVLLIHITKSMYQFLVMQVVKVGYQCQECHLKNLFTHLVTQSTLLTIGLNDLMLIIRTESLFIKVRWVSCFKKSQDYFLLKKCDDYKENYWTAIRELCGEWFINKMDENSPPSKRRRLIKTEQIKEDKIKENLMKSNTHWIDWKLQLHLNKLKWVDLKT